MELSSRCVQILLEIARERTPLQVDKLITRLGVTRRSLYYDLPKINDWLAANNLGKIETIRGQIVLKATDFHEVERLLTNYSSYIFSMEERRALTIFAIAASVFPITIDALSELLDVSKNTVLGDIKECKKLLEPARVSITAKRGYSIEGDEIALRKLIYKQIFTLKNEYPQKVLKEFLQKSLSELTDNNQLDFCSLVKKGIEEYEHSLGTWLIFNEMPSLETMILFACVRSAMRRPCLLNAQEKNALKNTKEYKAVIMMMHSLFEAGISLQMDEAYYVTILLLGVKNFDFNLTDVESDFIWRFTISLVDNFERVACVSFEGKRQFLVRLYSHIKPMYYRLKYGIYAGAALTSQIISMYEIVYEFTRDALARTNDEMSNLIAEEELAYLCVYMASNLGERAIQPLHVRPRILIICGAGVATSVLLREQLSDFLGDAFTYHLAPTRQATELDFSDYSLVVTTIPLGMEDEKIVQASPILSEENKARIMKAVYRAPLRLKEFLRLEKTFLRCTAATVKDAIREASEMLGVHEIQQRSTPHEAAPGIALEFVQKENGKVEFCILLFQTPLKWDGIKIEAMVLLATVDNFTHLPLLRELYTYLKDGSLSGCM